MKFVPVLWSGLVLEFKLAQGTKWGKDAEVVAHFFKVIDAHVGVYEFIKVHETVFKGVKLDRLGDLDVLDDTVSDVGLEVGGVSDGEAVPVDDLDLEYAAVYGVLFLGNFLRNHFIVECLGLWGLLHGVVDELHSLDFAQGNVVAIFIGVLDALQQLDDALLVTCNLFHQSFKRLLTISIIDSEALSKICKVATGHTRRLWIYELNVFLPALVGNVFRGVDWHGWYDQVVVLERGWELWCMLDDHVWVELFKLENALLDLFTLEVGHVEMFLRAWVQNWVLDYSQFLKAAQYQIFSYL